MDAMFIKNDTLIISGARPKMPSGILSKVVRSKAIREVQLIPTPMSDIQCYWAAFREFVEMCEDFAEVSKIKEDVFINEDSDTLAFVVAHYGEGWRADFLSLVEEKGNLRRIYGFKMSMCLEKVDSRLLSKQEAELLLEALSDCNYRNGFRNRIDEHLEKNEFMFPMDVLAEVHNALPYDFRLGCVNL